MEVVTKVDDKENEEDNRKLHFILGKKRPFE
jgi:hypothetical protein